MNNPISKASRVDLLPINHSASTRTVHELGFFEERSLWHDPSGREQRTAEMDFCNPKSPEFSEIEMDRHEFLRVI